jgi:uncharacterized membrane protein
MDVHAAITVNATPREAYDLWRDLERLPTFMTHLESVRVSGDGRSHWVATAPTGTVEWDAEIVEDDPGSVLAWRSLDGADVPNEGRVAFTPAPGGRGTEVRVRIGYHQPAGKLGKAVARLLGEDPQTQVEDDLRRFKAVLEVGEVVRSAASPAGTDARDQRSQRPAS